LTVWRKPPPRAVWLAATDLLLVIEIVSPGMLLWSVKAEGGEVGE
jgi:hypothetical protein